MPHPFTKAENTDSSFIRCLNLKWITSEFIAIGAVRVLRRPWVEHWGQNPEASIRESNPADPFWPDHPAHLHLLLTKIRCSWLALSFTECSLRGCEGSVGLTHVSSAQLQVSVQFTYLREGSRGGTAAWQEEPEPHLSGGSSLRLLPQQAVWTGQWSYLNQLFGQVSGPTSTNCLDRLVVLPQPIVWTG